MKTEGQDETRTESASRLPRKRPQRRRRDLGALVVATAIGATPGLLMLYFQSQASLKQALVNTRVDAIRAHARACEDLLAAERDRYLATTEQPFSKASPTPDNLVALFALDASKRCDEASANAIAAQAVADAVFGVSAEQREAMDARALREASDGINKRWPDTAASPITDVAIRKLRGYLIGKAGLHDACLVSILEYRRRFQEAVD